MGKKRKHESNSSETEDRHDHSPSRKKSKKVVDPTANLNEKEFEIWLVKKPSCIPYEIIADCGQILSGEFREFEYEETNYDCERQTLKSKPIVLLQKTSTEDDVVHEKMKVEPKGTIIVSRTLPKKENSFNNVEPDKGPPPIGEGLKQRFVPFGICPDIISKHKHKKKKSKR